MGLNHVTVEDERGHRIRSMVGDPGALDTLLAQTDGDSRFPTLNQLDPYGDTFLNRLQVVGLIADLRALLPQARKPAESNAIKEILELAMDVQDEPHLFLHVHGD